MKSAKWIRTTTRALADDVKDRARQVVFDIKDEADKQELTANAPKDLTGSKVALTVSKCAKDSNHQRAVLENSSLMQMARD